MAGRWRTAAYITRLRILDLIATRVKVAKLRLKSSKSQPPAHLQLRPSLPFPIRIWDFLQRTVHSGKYGEIDTKWPPPNRLRL
jgi:hypothetical protein